MQKGLLMHNTDRLSDKGRATMQKVQNAFEVSASKCCKLSLISKRLNIHASHENSRLHCGQAVCQASIVFLVLRNNFEAWKADPSVTCHGMQEEMPYAVSSTCANVAIIKIQDDSTTK